MKRLLMLVILAVVAVGQDPSHYNPNGLLWTGLSTTEKLLILFGAEAGFHEAETEIFMGKAGIPICSDRMAATYREKVAKAGTNTQADMLREVDAFYNVRANVSLPWDIAFTYSEAKLAGATKG